MLNTLPLRGRTRGSIPCGGIFDYIIMCTFVYFSKGLLYKSVYFPKKTKFSY